LLNRKVTGVSTPHAAEGLIGALDTAPWFHAVLIGLFLVGTAAGLFYIAGKISKPNTADGCLVMLLGAVGFVFGVTGFICLCLGFFGWF